MSSFGKEEAEKLLTEGFALWLKELDIHFDRVEKDGVSMRIPASPRLNREGGIICGQAMMALADTAMVFAISAAAGGYRSMTTVNQCTTFLRPAAEGDLVGDARLVRMGRQMVYGEVTLHSDNPSKPVAHITSNYMLLG